MVNGSPLVFYGLVRSSFLTHRGATRDHNQSKLLPTTGGLQLNWVGLVLFSSVALKEPVVTSFTTIFSSVIKLNYILNKKINYIYPASRCSQQWGCNNWKRSKKTPLPRRMCEEGGQLAHKSKERKNPPAFEQEGLASSLGVGVGACYLIIISVGDMAAVPHCHLMLVVGGWRLWHGMALALVLVGCNVDVGGGWLAVVTALSLLLSAMAPVVIPLLASPSPPMSSGS